MVRHHLGQVTAGLLTAAALAVAAAAGAQAPTGFGPGARVLLDGHNAYPERGRWADRIERVLATGTPVAIEQDLYWVRQPGRDGSTSVVAHDSDAVAAAPSFEAYFFKRIAPIMDKALAEERRDTWPLIVLNLDFKSNEPAHHEYVWQLLGKYERWLTGAPRTLRPEAEPLTAGPLLVLTGADVGQRARFYDAVPAGSRLRVFGALPSPSVPGDTPEDRALNAVRMSAAEWIPPGGDNYTRWVNFPWGAIEAGGQHEAGRWTAGDANRLKALVERAHAMRLWIRFYTIDGFTAASDRGFNASYNFGSIDAARVRWRAAIAQGVDFIATDQYADFARARQTVAHRARPPGK